MFYGAFFSLSTIERAEVSEMYYSRPPGSTRTLMQFAAEVVAKREARENPLVVRRAP